MKENTAEINIYQKPKGVLEWTIVATIFGILPISIIGIIKAVQARRQWKNGEFAKSEKSAKTADFICLVSILVSIIVACPLIVKIAGFISIVPLISSLIGVLEGMNRRCGMSGGLLLASFPVIGWILVSAIPYKGE